MTNEEALMNMTWFGTVSFSHLETVQNSRISVNEFQNKQKGKQCPKKKNLSRP